ncbi:RNA polymerase II C-terminal domain phosphatase-like 4 [Asparagus officinalis]|uniref:RNA polymerase II C-terminal domain phosphatase-like 4 n=1 Tax=Asparagus officinalis TaxID=4686 RepID=UPI00098E4207|nr:RNA polymerase II C-terminal domain phosphatase-like 4 [Asparagus officinalis]
MAENCKRLKKLADDESLTETPRCINKGVNLSSWDIAELRREHTERVLKEKKLMLILDLDNTLLHSTNSSNFSSEDQHLMQLMGSLEGKRDRSIFRWKDMVIKLRPNARAFLKEASNMYDMYIYTMGTREYATQMAEFLDPEGVYFKNKILSREDCTTAKQKGLDVVLGEERAIVILDDTRSVWGRHISNQIEIPRYYFFGPRRPVRCSALDVSLEILRRIHCIFFGLAYYADFSCSDVRRILLLKKF